MAMYPDPNNAPTQPEPTAPVTEPARPYGASYERERYVQPVRPVDARPSAAPTAWYAWRATQVVYLVFGVIEAIILIRFILKLLAANPDAAFTSFMYQISGPFVAPFLDVFPAPASRGSVLEISSLLAIVVYMLIAALIVRIIWLLRRRNTRLA